MKNHFTGASRPSSGPPSARLSCVTKISLTALVPSTSSEMIENEAERSSSERLLVAFTVMTYSLSASPAEGVTSIHAFSATEIVQSQLDFTLKVNALGW